MSFTLRIPELLRVEQVYQPQFLCSLHQPRVTMPLMHSALHWVERKKIGEMEGCSRAFLPSWIIGFLSSGTILGSPLNFSLRALDTEEILDTCSLCWTRCSLEFFTYEIINLGGNTVRPYITHSPTSEDSFCAPSVSTPCLIVNWNSNMSITTSLSC